MSGLAFATSTAIGYEHSHWARSGLSGVFVCVVLVVAVVMVTVVEVKIYSDYWLSRGVPQGAPLCRSIPCHCASALEI